MPSRARWTRTSPQTHSSSTSRPRSRTVGVVTCLVFMWSVMQSVMPSAGPDTPPSDRRASSTVAAVGHAKSADHTAHTRALLVL
jgi:hypothetical protein